jgi:hypothetical protein
MQVLVDDREYRSMQEAAKASGVTLAEWVRGRLRDAAREVPSGDAQRKLESVRAASRYEFPSGDIELILEEIERGYGSPR